MFVVTGTFHEYQSSARTKLYSAILGSTNSKDGRGGSGKQELLCSSYVAVHSFYLLLIPFRWWAVHFAQKWMQIFFHSASVLMKDARQMDVETKALHLQWKKHTSTNVILCCLMCWGKGEMNFHSINFLFSVTPYFTGYLLWITIH